jgi:hypothetical protein
LNLAALDALLSSSSIRLSCAISKNLFRSEIAKIGRRLDGLRLIVSLDKSVLHSLSSCWKVTARRLAAIGRFFRASARNLVLLRHRAHAGRVLPERSQARLSGLRDVILGRRLRRIVLPNFCGRAGLPRWLIEPRSG